MEQTKQPLTIIYPEVIEEDDKNESVFAMLFLLMLVFLVTQIKRK